MDTNVLISTLMAAIEAASQKAALDPIAVAAAVAPTNIWVDLAPAIIAVLTAFAVWFKVSAAEKSAARQEELNAVNAAKLEKVALENTKTLDKVLIDVNSGSQVMKDELKVLRSTVLQLSEERAAADEQLKRLTAEGEAERIIQERALLSPPPNASRAEVAEKKAETTVGALTDSEISKMLLELREELATRISKKV